ncbi:MAG: GtrA family protein [Actinomycetota bacterium]
MSLVADLHRRFATLIAELTKFGLVGTLALVTDLGGASLLHGGAGFGPLTAKIISASAATALSYTGHRLWTFRHRASQGILRGGAIFFGLNLFGLLISLLVISFVTNVLDLQSLAAYNAAQIVGVLLGMFFRYWSYRRWVFMAFEPGAGPGELAVAAAQPAGPLASTPPAMPPTAATPPAITPPVTAPARAAARPVAPRPVLKPDR